MKPILLTETVLRVGKIQISGIVQAAKNHFTGKVRPSKGLPSKGWQQPPYEFLAQ
jgi:hypothetical protein